MMLILNTKLKEFLIYNLIIFTLALAAFILEIYSTINITTLKYIWIDAFYMLNLILLLISSIVGITAS